MNAFRAKEISENLRYQILLNFLGLLIVGIVVAKCVPEFKIFILHRMHSQDTNVRRSYETRFQQ